MSLVVEEIKAAYMSRGHSGKSFRILQDDLREYYRKFWAGEIKSPCSCDCPPDCAGNHYYGHVIEYPRYFQSRRVAL